MIRDDIGKEKERCLNKCSSLFLKEEFRITQVKTYRGQICTMFVTKIKLFAVSSEFETNQQIYLETHFY